ncbi:MAG: choice-of-anchor D domain-containing protein [Bacteroidota bacterium]
MSTLKFFLNTKLYTFFIAAIFICILPMKGWGQTTTQNFGVTTGSHASQTGSTAFLPIPTSGTTYARAGAAAATATVNLATSSNPLGTTGAFVRAVCSSSASVIKVSPAVSYTASTEFYTSFKVLFGDASASNSSTSGVWTFYQGLQGTNYTDNTDVSSANNFIGLRFTFGGSGALTLTYNNAGTYNSTSLTTSAFSQGTAYTVEIIGNNKSSGTISYTYNGAAQTVAVQKFDLYINGTLVGNDLTKGGATANTNINATTFTGVTSTSNVANLFLDDVVIYNAVPASIGTTAPEINIKQSSTSYATASTFGFGSQVSGTSSSATTFTIENTGTATLNLSGTPIVAITGTNASEFSIDQSSTTATVAAAGTTTFTITFSPTTQGAKTAAISIANDDATGGENPYVINLTGTGTVSAASDITNTSGYTYTSNVDYASFQTSSTLTTGNSVGVNGLTLRDGGATTDGDNLGTTLSSLTFSTGGSTAIRTAALFDGSTNVKEVAVNGATSIAFTGLSLSATDGGTKDFELRVTYQSTVTDNQQITFTVSAATASSSTSNFAASNAGAAASSITSDVNRIEVTASALSFTQQPASSISAMAVMSPNVTLAAKDGNSNTDLDYATSVSMSVTTGSTTFDITATITGTFSSGTVSFSNLIFNTAANTNKITATSGSLSIESSAFDVTSSLPEINIKQGLTSYATASTFGFGNQVSGTSSSATTFTIENIGTATLNLSGTPIVDISGTNAAEFSIDQTSTSSTVATSSTTTFTITFSPTSQGAKTAAISIANDDATGGENPYVINLTGTGTVSAASDITNTSGYTYTSNIDYASFQTSSTLTTGNSVGVNSLTLRDGGATIDGDNLGTTLSTLTFSTGGSTAIRTAALFDGSTNVKEVAVNGATSIAFTGLSLSATDGGTKDFELRVTYQSTVTDNQQITFTVSAANASSSTSNFAASNAGAAASSTTADMNRIEVTISQLIYTQQPSAVNTNVSMSPSVTVTAKDANNNVDLDFTDNVRVSSTGTMTGSPVSVSAINGVATFSSLTHTLGGTGITLLAERNNSGAWDLDVTSNSFTVTAVSATTDYFRSKATGSWGTAATWESSADGSTNWITATLAPTSSANNITIRNGHTITISAIVTIDQVTVQSGGFLTLASGGVATIADGTGDDITIQNGGRINYQLAPTYNASSTIRINGGGILSIEVSGVTGNASGVNASSHIYDDGSILQWNLGTTNPSSSGVTFFPNVTSEIPILRFASGTQSAWGAGSATTVNGKIEIASGITITLGGTATKTFKYGIIGAGALTQSSAGQIIISGTNADLGGSGIITLGSSGLAISSGTTLLSSNKQIDGNTITISGTLTTGTYQLSGSSAVTISSGGTLKLASTSLSGALLGNIPTGTITLSSGSIVELNGASAQYCSAKTFSNLTINNASGVSLNSSSNVTVSGTLALGNNTLDISNNTLTLNGDLTTGTGVIKSNGSGSISIGGTGTLTNSLLFDQTTSGTTNRFTNVTLSRGTTPGTGSITLGNTLEITGTLTLTNGTFNTGGYLTLVSNASGTARVASIPSTATISGNVKSQRYVPAVQRRYRMFSPNTTSFAYTDLIDNIFVTGNGGTGGFDAAPPLNSPSIYTYQESTSGAGRGWQAVTSLSSGLSAANGALVYVRGDRTLSSPDWYTAGLFPSQNAVTIDFNGAINKGTITPSISYTNTSDPTNDGWNLVGNPYPSQINWTTISKTNLDANYYIYDPSSGSYVSNNGTNYISSGQAFFVQATGSSPSISFNETDKVSNTVTNYFKTAAELIEIKMNKDAYNSDVVWIGFDANSNKGFNRDEDAVKFPNSLINFGFYIDSIYTVQRNIVPLPNIADTFVLSAYAPVGTYSINVSNVSATLPSSKNIYLIDQFNSNVINLRSVTTYTFSITSNLASKGNRFLLVINDPSLLPVKWLSVSGAKNNADAIIKWQTANEKNNDHYVVERLKGNTFEEIALVTAKQNTQSLSDYNYTDKNIFATNNAREYYRIKQIDKDGKYSYSSTVAINDNSKTDDVSIAIFPNPASNSLNIVASKIFVGNTKIDVIDVTGKTLQSQVFNANEKLSLNISSLESGIYFVRISTLNGEAMTYKFCKE